MPHQRVREGRLARAVRPHDRVLLVQIDREVDPLDDLGAVVERDVQVVDLEQGHFVVGTSCLAGSAVKKRPPWSDGSRTCPREIRCYRARVPFGLAFPELLIILVAVLLIFGAKRLPEMGRSLGKGMREFKDAVTNSDEPVTTPSAPPAELSPASSESTARRVEAEKGERETIS